ncbi:hypothetical protein GCM10025874_30750 [Arenivirga flava]|uniref:Uncharacterized protein n=1 Tax=Arenivirga flava TaxID=1930060 RepID=A0AA37XDK3_9MICO|nr:hypothetical protein GCM10025874_30750 [Arenivirga flava]
MRRSLPMLHRLSAIPNSRPTPSGTTPCPAAAIRRACTPTKRVDAVTYEPAPLT